MNAEILNFLAYCPDTGAFTWKVSPCERIEQGSPAGSVHCGYLYIGFRHKRYYAHRLAWFIMTGKAPVAFIDHKNLDKLDNRWINLREATRAQNTQNCRAKGDLPKGVQPSGRGFKAQISSGGRCIYLGTFDTIDEAHAAYCAAATRLFGDFARAA
jgi:hypothetical protein